MMFEGMPWPLVLPIAIVAMIWGSSQVKREFALSEKKRIKKNKKRKAK